MNWTIALSDLPDFLRVTSEGTVTRERFVALWSDVISHDCWRPGMAVLMDNRGLERIGTGGLGLTSAAAEFFRANHDTIGAAAVAVVSGHRDHFMHARQFHYAIRNRKLTPNIQIFFEEQEAVEWLRRFSHNGHVS